MQFGEWQFTLDREATVGAYAKEEAGGSDTCTCIWCRNFRLVRDRVYPPAFLAFLDSVGIDPKKDGEIYHNGELLPGAHFYAGWFHFVGMWLRLWSCYSLCRVSRTNVERCNAVACGLGTFEIPGDASLVS